MAERESFRLLSDVWVPEWPFGIEEDASIGGLFINIFPVSRLAAMTHNEFAFVHSGCLKWPLDLVCLICGAVLDRYAFGFAYGNGRMDLVRRRIDIKAYQHPYSCENSSVCQSDGCQCDSCCDA